MAIDYVAFSNLIIDDIVFPDGRSSMDVLGGAGIHALIGMRVWNDTLGYAASIGADLSEKHRHDLRAFGVDVAGLIVRDGYQTARAWQIFEYNDYRHEIFRTNMDNFDENKVQWAELPEAYRQAKGYHIQWGTLAESLELLTTIRAENPTATLVMEAILTNDLAAPAKWQQILPLLDLFAPDEEESAHITGESDPIQNCKTLIAWGAPLVAIRMGAAGSILMAKGGGCWQLPAVPTNIVDVTGAGNSYCGGFTVALGEGLEPLEAALRAVVSASFALEQLGTPTWGPELAAEAQRRVEWARERVQPL